MNLMSRRRQLLMMGLLPSGYKILEFIESEEKSTSMRSGRAGFDTGVIPNTTFEFEFQFYTSKVGTKTYGEEIFYCLPSSGNGIVISLWHNNGHKGCYCLGNTLNNIDNFVVGDNVVTYKNGKLVINGALITSENIANRNYGHLTLFHRLTNVNQFNGKLYYFKMWKDGEQVRNYVPCLSPTNEYGMFDLVERKFYGSDNNYKFIGQ